MRALLGVFMSESSFMVLNNIGSLPLEDGAEVKFTIDAYRNYRYASIRKYLQTDGFMGATRVGITMTPEIVQALAPIIATLPDNEKQCPDKDLGKFAKRPGMSVVARVSTFMGAKGLDLRQWQEDSTYTGWTKKGIRLPYNKIKEIKRLFALLNDAFNETPVEF